MSPPVLFAPALLLEAPAEEPPADASTTEPPEPPRPVCSPVSLLAKSRSVLPPQAASIPAAVSAAVMLALGITARSKRLGTFAIHISRDGTPPIIQLAVDGQQYVHGGFLPREPRISAVIQDDTGIRLEETVVCLDGNVADAGTVRMLAADPGSGTLVLDYFPALDVGAHTIEFEAVDAAGNPASKLMHFEVASEFDLVVLGNFPNPFSEETVLAYTLTAPAKSLSVRIYTVSGHLVRVFRDDTPDQYGRPLTSPDYHELLWPGTDSRDRELANGVYFCRFAAESEIGGKTVERIIKLAKRK